MLKDTSSIILSIIIVVLTLACIALLIKCTALQNTNADLKVSHEQDIRLIDDAKKVAEEQVRDLISEKENQVIQQDQIEKVRTEYVTKEVEKIIQLPVYSNTCMETRGVELINQLIEQRGEKDEVRNADSATVVASGLHPAS